MTFACGRTVIMPGYRRHQPTPARLRFLTKRLLAGEIGPDLGIL